MKTAYPAYLKKGFQPYDPIELMRLTEDKVCRGETRKYTDFYCVGVYAAFPPAIWSVVAYAVCSAGWTCPAISRTATGSSTHQTRSLAA